MLERLTINSFHYGSDRYGVEINPEYGLLMQEAARAVRLRTAGALQEGAFLDGESADGAAAAPDTAAAPASAATAVAERLYAAELARELGASGGHSAIQGEVPPALAELEASSEDGEDAAAGGAGR